MKENGGEKIWWGTEVDRQRKRVSCRSRKREIEEGSMKLQEE